jgi:mannose-6-phosphate isomerase-like protein (cupin superfamily)
MSRSGPFRVTSTFARLAADGAVEPLAVTPDFFARLEAGQLGSFHGEFLVSCHDFAGDWPVSEMHPLGDEIVCLLSGSMTFVFERPEGHTTVPLAEPGAWIVVPRGVWHTAKVPVPSRALFITAGEGTQHRPASE